MPLGPVFRHEMLAAGRKRRYFAVRVLIGLGMLALLAVGYQTVYQQLRYQQGALTGDYGATVTLSISGVAQLTATFYTLFAWATMIGVLAVTPAVAAGAIASERERRTIEYLFATDLSNSEIVLDKLAARLLTVGKLVLATLPVLAIFRLLGGVPGSLLLTHFAMLASTATLTAAIALTVGVWCERARDAVPRALAAVFLWLIALPLGFIALWQLGLYGVPWAEWLQDRVVMPLVTAMSAVHPVMMLATSAGISGGVLGVDVDRGAIALMVGFQLLAAAALLGLTVAVVRRVHLNAASSPGVRQKAAAGAPDSRSPYERRPMLWKEMFAASVKKQTSKWAMRIGVTLLVIVVGTPLVTLLVGGLARYRSIDFEDYMQLATGMVGTCGSILVLLMGSRAAGLITYEHERDTWLSLLTTPLPAGEIVTAKTLGNLYAFRWPLIGVVLMPLLGTLLDISAVLATLGVAATLGCLSWTATAIGLAVSLRMKSSIKAIGVTVFVLLSIGAFYSGLAGTFAGLSGASEESLSLLIFPPLAPFLLIVPVIAVFDSTPDYIMASYFVGLILYGAVGFFVTLGNTARFDQLCGRSVGYWRPVPGTTTPQRGPLAKPSPDASL
ncbi:ABC-2 family transporter protein [Botrimarina colliarenosi]|uniref:ABC-2 family transporter protein n=1 Tax=Botrimarina colliarenosi TaxID=2528001 RepID=A0A5C6AJ43_9BACT|nr:ABC transporter permease subunit [Botrimarina colliarenosi]TWT99185.1 ABC-2 family transporter protein [Botrimarina colliarenosi]